MQTIQFTEDTDNQIDELLTLLDSTQRELNNINKNLEQINKTLASIGADSTQLAYLIQFLKI